MTDYVLARCPRCNPDGMELSRSTAEELVEDHNESKHDGEPVAEIDDE